MVEEQQQSSQPTGEAPAGEAGTTVPTPQQQTEASGEVTPEAIEAYWRKRQSNSDRAHAESERVLREQLAQAEAAAKANTSTGEGSNDALALAQRQNQELQAQLKQSEQQRITDTRRAMYPEAAAALEDNNLIAQMDEARLAGLNAKLGAEAAAEAPPQRVDRNNPAKGAAAPPKRISDMSSDELKQVLANESAAWVEEVRNS